MTSGSFKSIPISSILIDRDVRQRRELRGIDELADSLSRTGLINPIVVSRASMLLVAGERRLTAAKKLGWSHINVQWAEDLSEQELFAIELEENIKRLDLTWQEQADAIRRFHELRATEPNWGVPKTAKALGLSESHVRNMIAVGTNLTDQTVATAPKLSTAIGLVQRKEQRKRAKEMAAAIAAVPEKIVQAKVEKTIPLLNVPFSAEWIDSYSGPMFTFLHCDFPYGVNADSHDMGAAPAYGGYDDSFETYQTLLDLLDRACESGRVIAPICHMMFWFSMNHYGYTLSRLLAAGWRVDPFPLIWHKSDGSSVLPDAKRGPRRSYETAFHCYRGDAYITRATSNLVGAANTKLVHMSEKPQAMLRHFFKMYVDEHTNMLDPTCGSGNAVRVAQGLSAHYVLGLEQDPDFHARAVEAWNAEA